MNESRMSGVGGGPALPTPLGWTQQRFPPQATGAAVMLSVLTLGLAAAGISALAVGQPVPGVVFLVAAAAVGHVAGFALYARRPPRRSSQTGTLATTPDGTTGVRFRYSAWPYYWFGSVLVLAVLVCLATAAVLAATGTVAGIAVAVVLAALALLLGYFLIAMLRLAPGEVTVSPSSVYHRSLTFTLFLPWDAVAAVSATWLGTPAIVVKAVPAPEVRVRRYTGRFGTAEQRFLPFLVVRTYWLGTDPTTVYHALSFYHTHPDLRAELATPRAPQRINSGAAVGAP